MAEGQGEGTIADEFYEAYKFFYASGHVVLRQRCRATEYFMVSPAEISP